MKKTILITAFATLLTVIGCKDTPEERQEKSLEKKFERKYDKAQDYTYTNWVLKSSDSVRKIFKEKSSKIYQQDLVCKPPERGLEHG